MDTLRSEFFGAAAVVAEIGISTVNDDVTLSQVGDKVLDHPVGDCGGDHDPRGARLLQQGGEFLEGSGAGGTILDQIRHGVGMGVIDNAGVSVFHESPHDIGAHPTKSDHSELHKLQFFGAA